MDQKKSTKKIGLICLKILLQKKNKKNTQIFFFIKIIFRFAYKFFLTF
jgi:hypothetical protein